MLTDLYSDHDGLPRCAWAARSEMERDYHDNEWGRPIHGEAAYFERLTLELFQSGLSWRTILAKRDSFRDAFVGFDVAEVAAFGPDDIERLLADASIVRNRAKIEATIANAGATLALRATGGLEQLVLAHRPTAAVAPGVSTSLESTELARTLKSHGFRFVGPTTMHALLEATGLFDPHAFGCYRRADQ